MLVSSNYQPSNCELLREGWRHWSIRLGSLGRADVNLQEIYFGNIRITHPSYIHCRRKPKVHRNAVKRCRFLFNLRVLISLLYIRVGKLAPLQNRRSDLIKRTSSTKYFFRCTYFLMTVWKLFNDPLGNFRFCFSLWKSIECLINSTCAFMGLDNEVLLPVDCHLRCDKKTLVTRYEGIFIFH